MSAEISELKLNHILGNFQLPLNIDNFMECDAAAMFLYLKNGVVFDV